MQYFPNLRHLRAFCEVAYARSINKASERVNLSQPAVTQAISKVERDLGTTLFERTVDGMLINEVGELYLARAERALSIIRQGATEATRLGSKGARGKPFSFDQSISAVQLRALIAVSQAGNFSLAARMIGISQPALYRSARDLERLSNISLFDRHGAHITLTKAAHSLTKAAKLARAELAQGEAEVTHWLGEDSTHLRIGTMPLARSFILPRAINKIMEQNSKLRISVVDGPYNDLLFGLRHGELDLLIGALRSPLPVNDVIQQPLLTDQLSIVVRVDHPLLQRSSISMQDLVSYPWIVPREGTPTREHFTALFSRKGQEEPQSIIEASSLVLIKSLLQEGNWLTLISRHQIRDEMTKSTLKALPVHLEDSPRSIGITIRQDWRPTKTEQAFIEYLKEAGAAAQEPL